jgi:hypothetical protein
VRVRRFRRAISLLLCLVILGSAVVWASSSATAAPVCTAPCTSGSWSSNAFGTFEGQGYLIDGTPGADGLYNVSTMSKGGQGYLFKSATAEIGGLVETDAISVYGAYMVHSNQVGFSPQTPAEAAALERPTIPSSVAASTLDSAATTEGAAAAAAQSSRFFGAARVLQVAGTAFRFGSAVFSVYSAYEIGQFAGTFYDKWACGQGVSLLCSQTVGPTYVPNGDTGVDPRGWVGPHTGLLSGVSGTNITPAAIGVNETFGGMTYGGTPAVPYNGTSTPLAAAASPWELSWTNISGASSFPSPNFQVTAVCKSGPHSDNLNVYATGVAYTLGGYTDTGTVFPSSQAKTYCAGFGGLDHLALTGVADNSGHSQTVTGATWYPVGNPSRPTFSADPPRFFRTITTCTTGSNPQADSAAFHESDATWPPYPNAAPCPSGSMTREDVYELGTGIATKNVWGHAVPAAVTAFQGAFPACQSTAMICTLDLTKIAGGSPVTTGDCFTQSGLCEGWFADPTKSTDYQCSYGPAGSRTNVALTECNTLAPSFDAQQKAKGVTTGDPRTGAFPGAAGTVSSSGVPESGTSSSSGSGLPDPGNCFPSGYGVFNPLEWIFMPVKCALVWAFVPQTSAVAAAWGSAESTMASRPPLSIILIMSSFIGGVWAGYTDGCSGNIVNFGVDNIKIPCTNPIGASGAFTTVYSLMSLFIGGVTAIAAWKMIEGGLKQ